MAICGKIVHKRQRGSVLHDPNAPPFDGAILIGLNAHVVESAQLRAVPTHRPLTEQFYAGIGCSAGGVGLGSICLGKVGSPCWQLVRHAIDVNQKVCGIFFMAGNNEPEPAAKKVGFNFPRVMLLTKSLYATNKRFHYGGRNLGGKKSGIFLPTRNWTPPWHNKSCGQEVKRQLKQQSKKITTPGPLSSPLNGSGAHSEERRPEYASKRNGGAWLLGFRRCLKLPPNVCPKSKKKTHPQSVAQSDPQMCKKVDSRG